MAHIKTPLLAFQIPKTSIMDKNQSTVVAAVPGNKAMATPYHPHIPSYVEIPPQSYPSQDPVVRRKGRSVSFSVSMPWHRPFSVVDSSHCHQVLKTSKFKDESLYFHFHADEELEGTSSKNKQLCSDFKLVENILAKRLLVAGPQILPQEEDYDFNIEKKNKGVAVKTIKDPDHPEVLCFQIWGAALSCVYAMGRGCKPEAAGLSAGQCILKVNCSSIASEGALGVLKHSQTFQSCGQEALESGQWLVSTQSLLLSLQILEALAADDSAFMQNCMWLMVMSIAIMIMSHYDFCNIFNTKLESID
ncbi:Phosphatidylinositol 3,4,5-trisphosphate-dependent Rac exchanger 1 protein [Sciurus carolinensis]|uniref:Phosphatidylinositol 3,4,5-trisphosphate-dependent Rac exchanger 1 protein n=1 Tax=Sciurus carolinensis TaxID=30640 RepID=A0AA41MVN0_SCICA|nr:Phosphatidylinositol 3,4,5-trisphosphate-dependent Rac exchanger 1 protein [Sciurus carolinensis]